MIDHGKNYTSVLTVRQGDNRVIQLLFVTALGLTYGLLVFAHVVANWAYFVGGVLVTLMLSLLYAAYARD